MPNVKDLQRAIDYMEQNISVELPYERVAAQAYLSSYHFQRLFSIVCGCTVGEYIRNRRLSLAKEEVLGGEASLLEIALKYGYDTPEGFTRAFHRMYGVTPSAARSRKTELPTYPKLSLQEYFSGGTKDMDDMTRYSKRGYYVKENAPVYFARDIEATCKWFREVLGWYGDITARDQDGKGSYGCVFDYPGELIVSGLTPFRGIHMFQGEPSKGVVGFINVQNIEALHDYVTGNGWTQISPIITTPWDARECCLTTIDGSLIRFFETN